MIRGVCLTGKIGYPDELEAMLRLTELSAKHDGNEKQERNVYPCRHCGLFHLTSWRITP